MPCDISMSENRKHSFARLVRALASLKLTVVLLLILAGLVIAGTVIQASSGIYAAQARVFGSWVFWLAGVIPLPGVLLASLLLFLNLLAALVVRMLRGGRRAGMLLVHCGLLLLIGGGFFISITAREYSLTLGEGESSNALDAADGGAKVLLPMSVKLLAFTRAMHPGSGIPRSFTSRIEIRDAGTLRQAVISMNRPLRYRGYTFYQSSYGEDGQGGEISSFQVVRNSGRWLPYAASALIFLGLAGHFLAMLAAALRKRSPAKEPPRP
jgi:hypothetical protein